MRLYPELADEEEPLTGSHEEKQMWSQWGNDHVGYVGNWGWELVIGYCEMSECDREGNKMALRLELVCINSNALK
jgi:hypothetical protein